MGVHNLSDMTSFKTSVIEGSSDQIVVVDFFATWCGPCKAIAPQIVKMSNEDAYSDKVVFVKIDVDEAPDVAQEQGIRAMPTFGIFKNGQKVDEVVGADPRALRSKIDALLQSIESGTPYVKTAAPFNFMSYVPLLLLAYLLYSYLFANAK